MGIDLLILTLDGVMFDTEDAHLRACNAAFVQCGLDLQWNNIQYREAARARGVANAISAVSERISSMLTSHQMQELADEKNRFFHVYAAEGVAKPHQGCARLIQDAQSNGCKLAVVTDMPARTAAALLEQAYGDAVTDIFDVVITGARYNDASGNGPYQLAMRTVGIEAARSAAIEAAAPSLHAAQAAGIWTIAASPYEKDVARIAGADLWCPHLQELRDLIGKKETARERGRRFVTFDALRVLKKTQLAGTPVLRPVMQVRPSV
ncbi:HAD family hydrolase [Noviherbaspirillum saxi]|uniref:phosphoglycolate phosphatase n=1 Tax=Noviherbaspirillum saxi TaxID=2320863 RepID=A0A3A3FSJ7_9BURK|nr:HAD hydrolase-like protein [Noviherbaspirillum saxi]RJF99187.1 hypothetical protein D3871_12165 [Noviherbaspirillum saxi]